MLRTVTCQVVYKEIVSRVEDEGKPEQIENFDRDTFLLLFMVNILWSVV